MQGSFVQMALGRSHMKAIFIYLALMRSDAGILCFPGKGMLLYIHCYFRVLNVLGMCQSYLYFFGVNIEIDLEVIVIDLNTLSVNRV